MTTPSPRQALSPGLIAAVFGLAASLGFTLTQIARLGHAAFNATSDGVMWGLPIVTYEFFVSAAIGLTLIASLFLLRPQNDPAQLAPSCLRLAIAALSAAFLALGLELGHPIRMLWAVPFSFQFHSPMWWKGVLYPGYFLALVVLYVRLQIAPGASSRLSRTLALVTLLLALAAALAAGLVYGLLAMRPFWFDALQPLYYLAGAAVTGLAFMTLVLHSRPGFPPTAMPVALPPWRERTLPLAFATAVAAFLLLASLRLLNGLWSHRDGLQVFAHLLRSPLSQLAFWGGLVLPLLLLLTPAVRGRAGAQVLAALLVLLGQFLHHYEFVIGGQLLPLFKGSWVRGFIAYSPSLTEWALMLSAGVFCLTLYIGIGRGVTTLIALLPGQAGKAAAPEPFP